MGDAHQTPGANLGETKLETPPYPAGAEQSWDSASLNTQGTGKAQLSHTREVRRAGTGTTPPSRQKGRAVTAFLFRTMF